MRFNIATFTGITGFSFLVLGLLCSSFIFPKLEKYLIEKATALEEGSHAFEAWKKIPFPFKLRFYFFNVTNPDEVSMGFQPIFKEMGPYIYDEFREREILELNDKNDTISYVQRKTYFYNADDSGCRSEDDIVTIIHFPIVTMADKIYKISPMALPMLDDALPFLYPNTKSLFITDSVRNILFDGLKIMCESEEVDMICDGIRSKLPHTMRVSGNNFLLSLFHHTNGTVDGPYQIERGLKNTVKGKIVSFKGNKSLSQWTNKPCKEIRGTDLTINPSLQEVPKSLDFFVPDFCRYFSVDFDKELTYLDLQTYHFQADNLFQRKSCFCGKNKECPPLGTMDITSCSDSPIMISQPHFLNAEESLLTFSQGLKPNRDKHGTFIIMEPKTGLALNVKSRFQMSIFVKSHDEVGLLSNISEGLFPFIWLENGAQVPGDIIRDLQNNFERLKIFGVIKYLFIVIGSILLGVSFILALIKDKIFCFCGRKNAVSDQSNDQFKILDSYTDLAMNNATMKVRNNVDGRYVWRITE